ncbi:hypothetical protein [Streptomyces sp. ALI-76-A]|uniref:hypothetical protein n=1 Tax=Streptomyces sp. ALI-76-A TaxID=3025736 RepID=UPI00256EF76B|nr:hypothetical protein [Streptomyces sp. ALI-76-A]MDL5203538.1 hypothetical protein [Streptomyces sp. ALI-76-A]
MSLISAAVEAGICDSDLLDRVAEVTSIEAGEVSRSNLLQIYRRRLKRVDVGSGLHEETKSLISFLESFEGDHLVMISITLESGGGEMFIADAEESRILHWMRMFSR